MLSLESPQRPWSWVAQTNGSGETMSCLNSSLCWPQRQQWYQESCMHTYTVWCGKTFVPTSPCHSLGISCPWCGPKRNLHLSHCIVPLSCDDAIVSFRRQIWRDGIYHYPRVVANTFYWQVPPMLCGLLYGHNWINLSIQS